MRDAILGFTLLAALIAGIAGCKVEVNKSGENGRDNVKIATPFGGIAVNQDQATATELGLPSYPGAVQTKQGNGSESAKIDMDFGSMHMRVKVAHYSSPASQADILAFYRKSLTRYGDVIECAGGKPVGPSSTTAGLTCDSSGHDHSGSQGKRNEVELRAGSSRHQHLVVFPDKSSSPTDFTLIALDLPHGFDLEQKGTN